MKTGPDSKFVSIYFPLILFLAGFIWKFVFINHRDISLDEPFTIFNAQKPISEILSMPAEGEPNPPLFMILMHFWIKLFGISVFSVRFMPLLFNSITILFLYFTGKRYFGLWAGIIAAGLFIFSNIQFFHGLEARTYSLFSMATASSLYFFLGLTQNVKNTKALAGLLISNMILVYSHYFGWFVLLSQFLSSFLYIRNPKVFFRFIIAQAATVVAFLPMIPLVLRQFELSSKGTWLTPPGPHEFTHQLYFFLNHKEVYRVITYLLAAGVLLSLYFLIRKKREKPGPGILVLLLWWLVPYTIMYYVSSKIPMFNSRYVLFTTIGLFVIIGALIDYLYQGNRYLKPLAGLILLGFMFSHLRVLPDDFGHREWKNSADFLKSQEEGSVILIFPKWSDVIFAYHYDQKIFKDYRAFDQNLAEKHIYSVWGIQHVRSLMASNPGKRIIYVQDGVPNPGEDIFGMLDSAYRQTSQRLFPEMIVIRIYEPR